MIMSKTCLFGLFIFFAAMHRLTAQEYPLQHYSIKEGLPHVTVYRIFQDKKGFLWFSTNYGVSKFDGKTFRNFSSKDGLSNNVIMSVSENDKGDIFISTHRGGVNILSESGIRQFGVTSGSMPKTVAYTYPCKNRLWIISFISGNRLFLADKNRVKPVFVKNEHGKEANIYRIYHSDNDILFATSDGVYKVRNDTEVVPFLLKGEHVADVKKDKKNGYWLALKTKVVHVCNNIVTEQYQLKPGNDIGDLLVDRHNNVWVAANPSELYLIRNNELSDVRQCMDIPKVFITNLCEDYEGNIWIATHGNGLYRLNSLEGFNYTVRQGHINSYCTAIVPGLQDELILGSFGKLSRLKNGILETISSSLISTEFIYFIERINGKFYIGAPYRLLCKEMSPTYSERKINKEQFGAISICQYKGGQILVGTYDNLYKLNGDSLVVFDSSGIFKDKRCNYIFYDNDILWVLTDSGTIRYEKGHGTYQVVPGYDHAFTCGKILKDRHNRIWFSTREGLVCKDGNDFRVYTIKDGLADDLCKYLYEDDSGNLWVSTGNNRVNIVNLRTLEIKELILDIDLTEILCLYRRKNKLFIGTIEGLSLIDLSQKMTNDALVPTYILSVKTPDSQYISPSAINLGYKSNKLQIEFIGINFRHPENVEYRYMIRNLDDVWRITKNASIELSSLPGGNYTFLLSSRLKNGRWGPVVTMPLSIAIPLWQQTWFIAAFIVFAIVVVYLVSRKLVIVSEKKKNEQLLILNKITYLKQQALGALMNPHFIFNCMNSIQHYLNKNDKESANIYLSDFASLIRMTMEDAQKAFITLEKEILRLNLYLSLEQLRFGHKLQYQMFIDDNIDTHAIRIPNMIIQPYIENAILHGIMPKKGNGKIFVSFKWMNENEIRVIVEDNGVGLNYDARNRVAAHHSPLGMKLTHERLKLLRKFLGQHYDVHITEMFTDENVVSGTEVEIILPVNPDEKNISLLEDELKKHN